MKNRIFGNLSEEGLEVVEREGRYFIRYDAGAHQIAWREDEITSDEFIQLKSGPQGECQTIIKFQHRLELSGANPYRQNWVPSNV